MKKDKNPPTELVDTTEKSENNEIVENDPEVLEEGESTAVENGEIAEKQPQPRGKSKISQERRWLPYVITAAALAALALLVAWSEGGYSRAEIFILLGCWGDAFAIPGAVCFAVGVLIWASNGGAFDIFAYGGRKFIHMFKKDVRDHKYPTYYDYREARKQKKRSFLFMVVVGGAYLTVGIVLLVVGKQLMPAK